MLSEKRLKHEYLLVNGEDIEIDNYFVLVAPKMIWKYSEPLDGESFAELYQQLEVIENILS